MFTTFEASKLLISSIISLQFSTFSKIELNERAEIWVRMVLRTPVKAVADGFGRLFPWMALSGPAYTCGFQGLNNTSELLGIWPTLIPRERVQARLEMLEVQS